MPGESLLCCSDLKPYKKTRTDYESHFTNFISFAKASKQMDKEKDASTEDTSEDTSGQGDATEEKPKKEPSFAIQLVKQVNFGPLESSRYFFGFGDGSNLEFVEGTERELIDKNFSKVNTYKNFKCTAHNKFYELNLYKKDPVDKHHWRADVARPAGEVDL